MLVGDLFMPKVKVDDININYEKDGSGPAVVLVHGHGGNVHVYDDLAAYLKSDYTVIRIDQRGYGLTDKPLQPAYSTELWADDIQRLLRKLAIRGAVVAGHSMGGRVCATFAANYPRMAKGLITLNTTWFGTNPKAADELEKNATRIEKEGMKAALEFSPWINTIPKSRPDLLDSVTQEVMKNDPAAYALGSRAVAKDFRGGSREDILKAVKCPTLVLIGDRDSAPLEGAIQMYRGISNSRLAVIPYSGHFSILEKPEISKAVIGDFLKEIRPSL